MADAIRHGLRLEAIAADIAGDGDTALELLGLHAYDIAVLDRDIPGPTGDEIAERIVASGSGTPILMLTAADRLDDKATGFELGADDYLTKPFELRELVLRLRALDRRRAHSRPPVREIAGLRLDPFRREVYRNDRYVALTRKQFAVLEVLVAAEGASSAPRSSWRGRGTRTQTRSPTPCASRSRDCANGSASPGSSPPWPASATASTRNRRQGVGEETVARAPGLSVRLKLTLSYVGFLMLIGAVLLVVGYFSLSRGVHPGVIFMVRSHGASARLRSDRGHRAGVPARLRSRGRVVPRRPHARPPDPHHGRDTHRRDRIALPPDPAPGPQRRVPRARRRFDAMLARLEAHVAEQQRFAANASHELRTPLAITQTLLDVARNDPERDNAELVDRLHAVNTRAIDLTEALLLLSRADQRSFPREHVDLSLVAEEATETLLPLAERRGLTIETSGDLTPTIGSHALLLQLRRTSCTTRSSTTCPSRAPCGSRPALTPKSAVLTVENTGEKLTPQLVATLAEPF